MIILTHASLFTTLAAFMTLKGNRKLAVISWVVCLLILLCCGLQALFTMDDILSN